jgi:hypothetical protein
MPYLEDALGVVTAAQRDGRLDPYVIVARGELEAVIRLANRCDCPGHTRDWQALERITRRDPLADPTTNQESE